MTATTDSRKIAQLNDHARQTFTDCRVLITPGINALGEELVQHVLQAVQQFDEFTADNDPYQEHDFGKITIAGNVIFWKFDYYDLDLQMHSIYAADPTVTCRILTIMLAEEY
jgi:hypothetical protein